LVPVRVDGVDLLVTTVPVPGTQPTASSPAGRVIDAFDQAQAAIVALAGRVAGTVTDMGRQAAQPDEVQVAFGLAFGSNGGIVLVGASVEASLTVTITYKRDPDTPPAPAPPTGLPTGVAGS
jgi:hypothetical protein